MRKRNFKTRRLREAAERERERGGGGGKTHNTHTHTHTQLERERERERERDIVADISVIAKQLVCNLIRPGSGYTVHCHQ